MILRKCDMKTFSSRVQDKRLACYGIGGEFKRIIDNYRGYGWQKRICYLLDGNRRREGEHVDVGGLSLQILPLEYFLNMDLADTVILITCTKYAEIIEQLNRIPALEGVECYLFHFMFGLSEGEHIRVRQKKKPSIPPVIHYCWFGRGDMPELYKRCIESWHYYCPDYEVREWNEDNCDIAETVFTRQAYEAGKYGFVPDYFRLKIIYENGGIYLDTDVEVLKNLDDLRYNQAFCGMQFPGEAAFGLGFGAVKKNRLIKKLSDRYKRMGFKKEDGSYDETISPVYQTLDLMGEGMGYGTGLQTVQGMTIYPIEVLSPQNIHTGEINKTEFSYCLHHYDGSWVTGERLKKKKERQDQVRKIQKLFIQEGKGL